MKCRICGRSAALTLRSHNLTLCASDFLRFFERQVARTIERYDLLEPGCHVVLAVSGGKDSLVLWDTLIRLGYAVHGIHIDLGIEQDDYSSRSREKSLAFASSRDYDLSVVSLGDEYGFTVVQAKDTGTRNACAVCGLVKRYVMNRFASSRDAVLATGHNLDDEVASLMSNLLSWKRGFLARQAPRLDERPGLARKVKPLAEVSERESAAYAIINGIDYIRTECPHAERATSIFYKGLVNEIEHRSPGTKRRFYRGFLDIRPFGSEEVTLSACTVCGQPTTTPPCSFCRLRERVGTAELR